EQYLVATGTTARVETPLVRADHFKTRVAMAMNPSGGVVAVAVRSLSGSGSAAGGTVALPPSLGRMMYAPASLEMAAPDPAMAAVMPAAAPGGESYAWALGVQPHVSIMQFALHGVSQIEPPYAIDDVIWPGSF